jgi:hypothetical protein
MGSQWDHLDNDRDLSVEAKRLLTPVLMLGGICASAAVIVAGAFATIDVIVGWLS